VWNKAVFPGFFVAESIDFAGCLAVVDGGFGFPVTFYLRQHKSQSPKKNIWPYLFNPDSVITQFGFIILTNALYQLLKF